MARASVELIVEAAKAINPLRKVEQQSKKVEAGFNKLSRSSKRSFSAIGRSATNTVRAMTDVKNAIAGAAVGFAAFKAGQTGIARAESIRRLQFLAKGYGEVAELQAAATASAEKFGLGQTEANKALANVYARLRPVGASLKDITSIYNGFNTVAKLSGASSVEASNAFTQLAQALGSGALRGDEFNSIAEQVPGLLTAISRETGIAQGSLRAYAAEGKITSDIVLRALKRIETEGADQLKDALGGPAQAIKDFQNATEDVQVALTQDIVPLLAESFRGLAELIVNLEGPIRFIGGVAANTLNEINSLIVAATSPGAASAARDIQAGMLPLNVMGAEELFKGTGPKGKGLAGMREESTQLAKLRGQNRRDILLELMQNRLAAMNAQPEAPQSVFDLSTLKTFQKESGRKESGRGTKPLKERIDMSQKLYELSQRLRSEEEAGNERAVATLQHMVRMQQIKESDYLTTEKQDKLEQSIHQFRQDIFAIDKQIADQRDKMHEDAQKQFNEFFKSEQEAAQKRLEADPGYQMRQRLEEMLSLQNQVAAGATAIGNAFSSAFRDVITGTKSANEALADMMSAVAEHFLDMAKQIIAQQLAMILYGTIMKALGVSMPGAGASGGGGSFAGVPMKILDSVLPTKNAAEGGFVDRPTNALIGEGGEPEYVIPESKMRESMARYSRGSRGASVIAGGDGDQTSGDSSTPAQAPIDVRYTVERINSVDYVTADQFQRGMQNAASQGAKQGEQNTLRRLQMSGSTRRRIGM